LQADSTRTARSTRIADVLHELFAALNDDTLLAAECLARPIVADPQRGCVFTPTHGLPISASSTP